MILKILLPLLAVDVSRLNFFSFCPPLHWTMTEEPGGATEELQERTKKEQVRGEPWKKKKTMIKNTPRPPSSSPPLPSLSLSPALTEEKSVG